MLNECHHQCIRRWMNLLRRILRRLTIAGAPRLVEPLAQLADPDLAPLFERSRTVLRGNASSTRSLRRSSRASSVSNNWSLPSRSNVS